MNINIFNRAGLRDLQLIGSCLATFRNHKYVMTKPFISIPNELGQSVRWSWFRTSLVGEDVVKLVVGAVDDI